MVTYLVGADKGGDARNVTDAVVAALKAKGKEAVALPIGPNKEATRNSHDSNYILIFCVNGGQAGATWSSFAKYYQPGMAKTIIAYQGWIGNPHTTESAARTEKLVIEHDAGGFAQSWMNSMIEGHTVVTFVQKYSDCFAGFCVSDKSAEDLGQKIANGTCGVGSDDDDDEGGSASTIKDAIKEVLAYWDADAECYVKDKRMFINKIDPPADGAQQEYVDNDGNHYYRERIFSSGLNIEQGSVSITDYNPDTVNVLTVHSEVMEDIVYRNEKLIKRFGEKPSELDAVKKVTVTETEDVPVTDTTDTTTADTTTTSDTTASDASSTDTGTETTAETKTVTKEVACETPEEVKAFAEREWAKIKRDNGHSIELATTDSQDYQVGSWAKVYIPEFEEDDYMYITKVSHANDGETKCNLTFEDYPPSFGELKETDTDDEDSEDTDEASDDTSTEATT